MSTIKKRKQRTSVSVINLVSNNSVSGFGNKVRGVVGETLNKVHGYEIDPRYARYRKLESRDGKCIIDGREFILKQINNKLMWTLDSAQNDVSHVESSESDESSSSSCFSVTSSSSSSSSLSEAEKKRRRQYKKRKTKK